MAKSISEIESEARQLTANERVRLIRRLLATLEVAEEGDVERAWLDEADRRLSAYRKGETTARPGTEVFEAILSQY